MATEQSERLERYKAKTMRLFKAAAEAKARTATWEQQAAVWREAAKVETVEELFSGLGDGLTGFEAVQFIALKDFIFKILDAAANPTEQPNDLLGVDD